MRIFGRSIFVSTVLFFLAGNAVAQDLEPRSFSQVPVGMNFLGLSYSHAAGEVLFEQAVPITGATGRVNTLAAAYVRTLGLFGDSAKFKAILPYSWGYWSGDLDGDFVDTAREGFSDPRLELSVNFLGAPAIKMSEMQTYTKHTVVGASLQVVVPLGQYYSDKLVNLGQNRWAFRPRVGLSHRVKGWNLETMVDVWLFADNTDFYGGTTASQDPLWSVQANVIYLFRSGIWMGVGLGGSRGGKVASNGVYGDNYHKNARWGAIITYPLNLTHSVKLLYIDGLRTRLGSDFDQISATYQLRWGGVQ